MHHAELCSQALPERRRRKDHGSAKSSRGSLPMCARCTPSFCLAFVGLRRWAGTLAMEQQAITCLGCALILSLLGEAGCQVMCPAGSSSQIGTQVFGQIEFQSFPQPSATPVSEQFPCSGVIAPKESPTNNPRNAHRCKASLEQRKVLLQSLSEIQAAAHPCRQLWGIFNELSSHLRHTSSCNVGVWQ